MNRIAAAAAISLVLLGIPPESRAAYPERPIHVLVGFPPGGPPDLIARLLSDYVQSKTGQRMVVENMPGAGGDLALERLIRSPGDGYYFAMAGSPSVSINPALGRARYNPELDFLPVATLVETPLVLVVPSSSTLVTLADVLTTARSTPGGLTFGTAGPGTPGHLAGEILARSQAIELRHVPYTGIPALLPDLVTGRISMAFSNVSAVLPQIRDGAVRALAAPTRSRIGVLPMVPTFLESGISDEMNSWVGLVAPASTPKERVEYFATLAESFLSESAYRERLQDLGMDVSFENSETLRARIQAEYRSMQKLGRFFDLKMGQ
jgi:tripartite-type tricarboxylate transporter receptor subunit TctC